MSQKRQKLLQIKHVTINKNHLFVKKKESLQILTRQIGKNVQHCLINRCTAEVKKWRHRLQQHIRMIMFFHISFHSFISCENCIIFQEVTFSTRNGLHGLSVDKSSSNAVDSDFTRQSQTFALIISVKCLCFVIVAHPQRIKNRQCFVCC